MAINLSKRALNRMQIGCKQAPKGCSTAPKFKKTGVKGRESQQSKFKCVLDIYLKCKRKRVSRGSQQPQD
jgi:hypothetical protein